MRYLAININYVLDQDWYCRFASVLDCYKYFDSLGSGHGPAVAVYDLETEAYLWIDDTHSDQDERLNGIVSNAMQKIKSQKTS